MREILGNHLTKFFVEMTAKNEDYKKDLMRTYKGDEYEVHSISDELFEAMCDMSDEEFEQLAGEDAWWRSADGSNMDAPDTKVFINGNEMLGWAGEPWEDEEDDEEDEFEIYASSLTNYLCDVVGASQPRNVCALAVDLAKYNNMTMGELFTKYEG